MSLPLVVQSSGDRNRDRDVVCLMLDVDGLNWLIDLTPEGDGYRDVLIEARERVGMALTGQLPDPIFRNGMLVRSVTAGPTSMHTRDRDHWWLGKVNRGNAQP